MMTQTPIHVLLADDQPDLLEPLQYWLEGKGYRVTTAPDGVAAVAAVESARPDIVFLDIQMPKMNGLEALGAIRAKHPTLPVIMLTAAHDTKEYFDTAKAQRADGFFPKQSNLNDLTQIIETTLRLRRMGPSK